MQHNYREKILQKYFEKLEKRFNDIGKGIKNVSNVIEKTYYSSQLQVGTGEKQPYKNPKIENLINILQNCAKFAFTLSNISIQTYGVVSSVMTATTIFTSEPLIALGIGITVLGFNIGVAITKNLIKKFNTHNKTNPNISQKEENELTKKEIHKNIDAQNIIKKRENIVIPTNTKSLQKKHQNKEHI